MASSSRPRPSPLQYLSHLKQPAPSSDPFELQESDVIWGASTSLENSSNYSPRTPTSPAPTLHHLLCDPNPSLLRPVLSAISAAKAIPHSPPGPRSQSGSGPRLTQMSAPVNVPVWPKKKEDADQLGKDEEDDDDDEYAYDKMVPPHEIVARSHVATAFSVFEGAGRTLKGRDLRRVRNAVFRKTGFID